MDIREELDLILLEMYGYAFSEGDRGMASKKSTDKAHVAILSLFTHLIEEEAKGMKARSMSVSSPMPYYHVGYEKALSDLSTRLIEAVKGKV